MRTISERIITMIQELQKQSEFQANLLLRSEPQVKPFTKVQHNLQNTINRLDKAIVSLSDIRLGDIEDELITNN